MTAKHQTKDKTMASIHKDIPIDAEPAQVWAAVRDFGAVHRRLAPGFVLDARLDGDARIVTFANGTVARELLVDCDDARRRLVYAVISERVKHYNASVQVLADGDARSRLIWIVDLLPNEIALYVGGQMEQAVLAMTNAFVTKAFATKVLARDPAPT
jgi:carbon monoxide dehydrogenase subunit G